MKFLKRRTRLCWCITLAMVLLCSLVAYASECDSILRQGVFDDILVDSTKELSESLLEWLIRVDYGTIKKKEASGFNFGFPIDGVPLTISGSHTSEEFDEWRSAINQGRVRHFTQQEVLKILEHSASPVIIGAWLECMRLQAPGLSCSYETNADTIIVVTCGWHPNSLSDIPPTVIDFQVANAFNSYKGFPFGFEIPVGRGSSVMLERDGFDPVSVVLNTTKGSASLQIPAIPVPPPRPVPPKLNLRLFSETGSLSDIPETRLTVPSGYKIVSGGCRDNYQGYGNVLTRCSPEDSRTWVGRGKAHFVSDPSTVTITVVALYDPNDEWDVRTFTNTCGPDISPSCNVAIPGEFVLTGGGAVAFWSVHGVLLTDSYPSGTRQWTAAAKAHGLAEAVPLQVTAIGIKPKNGSRIPDAIVFSQRSAPANHPSVSLKVSSDYELVGGGASTDGTQQLLTSLIAVDSETFEVSAKDHEYPDVASVAAYALAFKKTYDDPCTPVLRPADASIGANGGTIEVTVNIDTACPWTAEAVPAWVTVSPKNGAGSQKLTLQVLPAGRPRKATLNIAGNSFVVRQDGPVENAQQPDLLVTSLSGPTKAKLGDRISISATLQNQGSAPASTFRLGLYLSNKPNSRESNQGETLLASCTFSAGLAESASTSCVTSALLPVSLVGGNYYLVAVIDDLASVQEILETNNVYTADSGVITIEKTPGTGNFDFTGDSKPDLIWQHGKTGKIGFWPMDGIRLGGLNEWFTEGDNPITPFDPNLVTDTNWKIVGVGDFDNNGKPDLVWQHQLKGLIGVWYMDGPNLTSATLFNPAQVTDTNWKIVGVGDFDNNGKPDLVWQHQLKGLIGVWYMDGSSLSNATLFNPTQVTDTNWKIVGIADFDNNGKPDLVWQHRLKGLIGVWYMDGINLANATLFNPSQETDTKWRIAAVADMDGDSRPDLIWRDEQAGYVRVWLMDGDHLINSVFANPSQVTDTDWRIPNIWQLIE